MDSRIDLASIFHAGKSWSLGNPYADLRGLSDLAYLEVPLIIPPGRDFR